MRAGVVIAPNIPSSSGSQFSPMLAPRLAVGLSPGRQAAQQMAVCAAAHAGTLPGRPPRVAVQLPLRPRAAAALNVTVGARVVAPGPEGCHRSQVGCAPRFPENPQAICRVRGDLNSRFRENTEGHTRASDLPIDLPHQLAGRARTASGYTRIPRRQYHGSHHGRPCPQVTPCPLNTAAPPRHECARRGLDPIPAVPVLTACTGPLRAGLPLAAKSQTASLSWRLTAHRNPIEVCLPDLRGDWCDPGQPGQRFGVGEADRQSPISASSRAARTVPGRGKEVKMCPSGWAASWPAIWVSRALICADSAVSGRSGRR